MIKRIFLLIFLFYTSSYAKTIFIEGVDNKFICDGKQSSGGGFQKCGKITALKPMTLCFSSPSGMKCKKLQANETLDTNLTDKPKNKVKKKLLNSSSANNNTKPQNSPNLFDADYNKQILTVSNPKEIIGKDLLSTPTLPNPNESKISVIKLLDFNSVTSVQPGAGLDGGSTQNEFTVAITGYKMNSNLTIDYFTFDNYTYKDITDDYFTNRFHSDKIDWGYWAEDNSVDPNTSNLPWVAGVKTSTSLLDSFLKSSTSRNFTFESNNAIRGIVTKANNLTENINTGYLKMVFDFGAGNNSMSGSMAFSTTSSSWDVNLSSITSQITNEGFSADITNGTTSIDNGSLEGFFYGDREYSLGVGGRFDMTNSNGDNAKGVFKALPC